MKRLVMLALMLAMAPFAAAELYKYIDKDGKTVYTDQPPPTADTKQMKVQSSAPTGSTTAKNALDREKDLEKVRAKEREEAKKSDQTARNAQLAEERCAQATTRYNAFVQGGRISKYNAQGERELMTDAEIDAERDKARGQMEDACKKS